MTNQKSSSFWQRPSTRLGWWAVGLGGVFVLMFIINTALFMPAYQGLPSTRWIEILLPFYGIFMALCALAAGIVGLIAVIRKHERSWLAWLTILPGAFVLFLLLGELLVPH